jgi:hypothetical protein
MNGESGGMWVEAVIGLFSGIITGWEKSQKKIWTSDFLNIMCRSFINCTGTWAESSTHLWCDPNWNIWHASLSIVYSMNVAKVKMKIRNCSICHALYWLAASCTTKVWFLTKAEIFPVTTMPKSDLGLTQPPIQWV